LIRVVGPSFEIVSRWAEQGIPLKVAFAGIDRYFERYYRNGPRRRPVKIDFCEADVLDVFDEWRRATGISRQSPFDSAQGDREPAERSAVGGLQSAVGGLQSAVGGRQSLPDHLQRVVTKLSSARAAGTIDDSFDVIIDGAARELDTARAKAGGLRGVARAAMLDRLNALDRDMMSAARAKIDAASLAALQKEAAADLAAFKAGMTTDAYESALASALDQQVRLRLGLPVIRFD
jgi:hypothetical protein